MADSGVKLTELLMALSLATDLGFGQPSEHMLRSARISMRLGERLGLGADDLATLYDVASLPMSGAPSTATRRQCCSAMTSISGHTPWRLI